ncbi:hypothetical protein KIL84_003638, partial [Mauremys mutica]
MFYMFLSIRNLLQCHFEETPGISLQKGSLRSSGKRSSYRVPGQRQIGVMSLATRRVNPLEQRDFFHDKRGSQFLEGNKPVWRTGKPALLGSLPQNGGERKQKTKAADMDSDVYPLTF